MGSFNPYIDLPVIGTVYLVIAMYLLYSLPKYERPPGFDLRTARTRLLIVVPLVFCIIASICYVFDVSLWIVHLVIFGLAVALVVGSDGGLIALPLVAIGAFLKEYVLGFPELVQRPPETMEDQSTDLRRLIGRAGRTTTALRPLGKVELDGKLFDAEALSGEFIQTDQAVIISEIRNGRLQVEGVT